MSLIRVKVFGGFELWPGPTPSSNILIRVLTLLASRQGEMVSRSRLAEELWGAQKRVSEARMRDWRTIHEHVRVLRTQHGLRENIVTIRGQGYRLENVEVDANRFCEDSAWAKEEVGMERLGPALKQLESSLAVVCGEPLEDLAIGNELAIWVQNLKDTKHEAELLQVMLRMSFGGHRVILNSIQALGRASPHFLDVAALRMLALFRCGRASEALKVYDQTEGIRQARFGLDRIGSENPIFQLRRRIQEEDSKLWPRASPLWELNRLRREIIP